MDTHASRPWYINDRACDEYRTTLADGGRLPMLKTLKLIRSIVVNLGLIALSLLAVANGGQPTIIGVLGLLVLGAYNGLEFSDYLALVQAYEEVQNDE
jgi:hypothetical protein